MQTTSTPFHMHCMNIYFDSLRFSLCVCSETDMYAHETQQHATFSTEASMEELRVLSQRFSYQYSFHLCMYENHTSVDCAKHVSLLQNQVQRPECQTNLPHRVVCVSIKYRRAE